MLSNIPTHIDKCKGAMLATAIGDALGWPNEPRSKNRIKKPKVSDYFVGWMRSSNNPRWHDEMILPGEYSDDTQMVLSVARSIIAGDWEKFLVEKELPFWLNYERGGGSALLKAAKSCSENKGQLWQTNYTKGYFNAGGNGATMRILPHVIALAKTQDISVLMLDVVKDTLITHGHPRAFLGATCYAYALTFLMRKDTVLEYGELVSAVIDGQNDWGAGLNTEMFGNWLNVAYKHCDYDFSAEWKKTLSNMLQQLDFIKSSLKKGLILDDTKVLAELECFSNVNGAGDVATLAAIYLASRYANNPVLGIKVAAFSFGADTDTIASITGGLVGMLCGINWIPTEWKRVQDYHCLIQMTELLLADDRKEATKAEVTEVKAQDNGWASTPIGKMRLIDEKSVLNGKKGFVIIKKWQTVLGQTLYTKTFQPNDIQSQHHQADEQIQIFQQASAYDINAQSQNKDVSLVHTKAGMLVQENVQKDITVPNTKCQFALDSASIATMLESPQFKTNITVGKFLKIISVLMESGKTSENIAKQFNVEKAFVDLIKTYIR